MSDLADLLARVEAATEGDRGIDGLIARDLEDWLPNFDLKGKNLLQWWEYGGHWHLPGDPCDGRHSVSSERNPDPPFYTSSIDEAVQLVERRLKTVAIRIGIDPSGSGAALTWWPNRLAGETTIHGDAVAVTTPLAILAALLKAELAKAKEP